MFEVGRVCMKMLGRDANRVCVIISNVDKNYCLIDGDVRRRKVNKLHLEPLNKTLNIKENASTEIIIDEFKKIDIIFKDRSGFKKGDKKK